MDIVRVVTTKQMKEIEDNANSLGVTYNEMMENAGSEVADLILKNTKDFKTKIVLICVGSGNNGGDGYVVARKIKNIGGNPLILMVDGNPKTPDAITNFNKVIELGIEVITYDPESSMPIVFGCDIVVDGVYGTGFHGELNRDIKMLFDCILESDAVKYAIDIPSGVNADDCTVADGAYVADLTIALDSMKNAHISSETFKNCGRVVCVDIGIPEECHMNI